MILRGIRVRLYPTEEQKVLIDKTIGCVRFVYNQTLAECKQSYEQTQHFPSGKERSANLVPLKEEYEFLKDVRFVENMPLATDDMYIEDSYEIDFEGEFSDKNECFYLED